MLRLEGVDVAYGPVQALRGVSMEIREGEIVALLGANGAGKTTALRTISGLLAPRRGNVHFDGRRLDGRPAESIARAGIAHVPEGRRVFPGLSVHENLLIGAYCRSDHPGIASDLQAVLDLFPALRPLLGRPGHALSGGEQQMLAIGRALMMRPRLLLLDEPSLGLAPIVIQALWEAFAEINARGVAVLLVEQNVGMALGLAHRGYVLRNGSVAVTGTSAELKREAMVLKSYLGGTRRGEDRA
jgi:branched-chain amino acid transport system ATP-binding protein